MKKRIGIAFSVFAVVVLVLRPAFPSYSLDESYKQAMELLSHNDLQGAQAGFEAILRKKPNYPGAKVLLGLTLARLSEQLERNGNLASAAENLQRALGLDPDEAYWRSALARVLNLQGNTEQATRECERAAQLSPEDSGLAAGCGFGARRQNDDRGAAIPPNQTQDGAEILTVGGDVTEPVPRHRPDPSYVEKARRAQLQGETVLSVVVNAEGSVERATVAKSLGLGLDENALRTVRAWKFKPATRHGTPVPVRLTVVISFRLF